MKTLEQTNIETVEQDEMDLKTLVTQSEIDKENFARMLLRGEGNFMKQVLENPQPLGKPKKKTGNRFFHNFFKTIGL